MTNQMSNYKSIPTAACVSHYDFRAVVNTQQCNTLNNLITLSVNLDT